MYGAAALPKMSPRLLFSITIVNTEPVHADAGLGEVTVSAAHVSVVLPEVLAPQPATAAAAATHRTEDSCVLMLGRSDNQLCHARTPKCTVRKHFAMTAGPVLAVPRSMTPHLEALLSHVSGHAGVGRDEAERAALAVMSGI